MADGNAALRDVASSRRRRNSRGCSLYGCKLATVLLQWRVEPTACSATMAGRVDRYAAMATMVPPGRWLRYFVATADDYAALQRRPTTTLLYSDDRRLRCSTATADGYGALSRRLRCSVATADGYNGARRYQDFCFFLLDSFKLPYAQERKKKKKGRKRESFETCLVSLFSTIGSPLPILALLVGTHSLQQASFSKLPPIPPAEQQQ
jgi:hypothetical protein